MTLAHQRGQARIEDEGELEGLARGGSDREAEVASGWDDVMSKRRADAKR